MTDDMSNESGSLLARLELHRSLKAASPGFHLSDGDIDVIIAALQQEPTRESLRKLVDVVWNEGTKHG